MTKAELKRFRQRLFAIGKRIQGDFSAVADDALRRTGGEAAGNLSNAPYHLADLSNDTIEHEVAVGLLENQGFILEQISSALQRIDNGTYGRCQECRTEIPVERLDAIPYTPHCVRCAAQLQAEQG
jgi:RNA polymerase-binding transcription factor DksA